MERPNYQSLYGVTELSEFVWKDQTIRVSMERPNYKSLVGETEL